MPELAAMPYHNCQETLRDYLAEKGLWTRERWERLVVLGLTSIEELAFAVGDLNQQTDREQMFRVIKEIEGDWDLCELVLDNEGDPMIDCNTKKLHAIDKDDAICGPDDYELLYSPARGMPNKTVNRWSMVMFHAKQVALAVETERFKKGHGEIKMPEMTNSEREERVRTMRKEFEQTNPGVMAADRMPGRRCQDLFYKMVYNDVIDDYPHPELCTSEEQERTTERARKKLKRYDNPEHEKSVKHAIPTCTVERRMDFLEALSRRSAACHLSTIMRFHEHEQWVSMLRKATDPLNKIGTITIPQAVRVDEMIWDHMQDECRGGIQKKNHVEIKADQHPAFVAMRKHWATMEIQMFLVPMESQRNSDTSRTKKRERSPSITGEEREQGTHHKRPRTRKWNKEWKSWSDKPNKGRGKGRSGKGKKGGKGSKGSKGGKGGKNSGKGKKGSGAGPVPKPLKGLSATTKKGDPWCFGFQFKNGCPHAGQGGKCWNGLHGCMGCGKFDHGAMQCPKKAEWEKKIKDEA